MSFDQALEHCRAFVNKSRGQLADRREAWRKMEEHYRGCDLPLPPTPLFEETEGILDCMELLLAVAHQPVPGGVVEVGGESPTHGYEARLRERFHEARKVLETIAAWPPSAITSWRTDCEDMRALAAKALRQIEEP